MTAQVPDTLHHASIEYCFVDATAGPPFDPRRHGFSPVSLSTACWRGYICSYAIEDDRLLLRSLQISHGKPSAGLADELWELPVFCGVQASTDTVVHGDDQAPVAGRLHDARYGDCQGRYEGLGLELGYDGTLLIATDILDDGPRFMGTVMPWEFGRVLAVALHGGRVQSIVDVSPAYETLRSRYTEEGWILPEQRRNARRFLRRRIGHSFSL